jgi:hypothetical protein
LNVDHGIVVHNHDDPGMLLADAICYVHYLFILKNAKGHQTSMNSFDELPNDVGMAIHNHDDSGMLLQDL